MSATKLLTMCNWPQQYWHEIVVEIVVRVCHRKEKKNQERHSNLTLSRLAWLFTRPHALKLQTWCKMFPSFAKKEYHIQHALLNIAHPYSNSHMLIEKVTLLSQELSLRKSHDDSNPVQRFFLHWENYNLKARKKS